MKKSQINNAFYDDLTDWYTQDHHPIALLRAENKVRNPWIEKTLTEKFKGPCKVLDIGCGGGLLTNALAQKGHAVFGIDLSEKSLENARRMDLTRSVHYTHANAYQLPFENGQFDVVCAMDILEHVEDPTRLISEAARVLKKGGLFFFHTFNRNFLSFLFVIKGVELCVPNTPPHMHVYPLFLKPKELNAMLEQAHLKVEQIQGFNPDLCSLEFWKMVFCRKVTSEIPFKFTRSLTSGYCGFASCH